MRAAGEAGQTFIDVMTGRRTPAAGESPEKLLDLAVAAYTTAADDPAANHTEAWNQIGYLQKGYYQEQKKKGHPSSNYRQYRSRAFLACDFAFKMHEFCIKNDGFCFLNAEFCISTVELMSSRYRKLVDTINPNCMQVRLYII